MVVHLLSLVIGGAVLFRANRNQWFFGDEWDFIARRNATSVHDLFAPHNEHWSTIPILAYRLLVRIFGLHSYVPFIAVLIVLHLAVAFLLFRLLLQTGSDRWIAVGLTAVFILLGSGAENLLWAFQIGFVGSVLAGIALLLLVNHAGAFGARDVIAVIVATIGLMFSGVTVTMVGAAALCITLRRDFRQASMFVAVPAATYLLWLILIGRDGLTTHPRNLDSLLQLPQYVWRGLAAGLETTSGIEASGVVILLSLLVFTVTRNGFARTHRAAATAGAGGAVLLFLIVGVGRTALGVDQSRSSRYVYVSIALLLPLIGVALSTLVGAHRGRLSTIGVFLTLVLLYNIGVLRSTAIAESDRELKIKRHVLAAAELLRESEQVLGVQVEPQFSPDLDAHSLRGIDEDGRLPATDYGERDRLNAAVQLLVAIESESAEPPAAVLSASIDAVIEPGTGGCSTVRPVGPSPQLVLEVGERPATLMLTPLVPAELSVTLRSGSPMTVGGTRSFDLVGRRQLLKIAYRDSSPVIGLPPTAIEVCGLISP